MLTCYGDQKALQERNRPPYRMKQPDVPDHLTDGFFPATLPHTYFTWQIEPKTFHIIGAVTSSQGWRSGNIGMGAFNL
ncbi:MAG TPA: hypothetical protein VKO67_08330 [Smithellaceae bacterium]|nr:hypothetical protein [Smithellaceae bacterium]